MHLIRCSLQDDDRLDLITCAEELRRNFDDRIQKLASLRVGRLPMHSQLGGAQECNCPPPALHCTIGRFPVYQLASCTGAPSARAELEVPQDAAFLLQMVQLIII